MGGAGRYRSNADRHILRGALPEPHDFATAQRVASRHWACYNPAMLTISGLTYRVGGRHGRALFNEANAQIPEGSKIGLVGRNGIGKSTLLDLIRGRLLPDRGDIFLPRGCRVGFLAQEAPSGPANALDTVLAADRERARLLRELDSDPSPLRIAEIEERLDEIGARAAPGRAARILAGLGLDAAMQALPLFER